jgi:hypothetical protein
MNYIINPQWFYWIGVLSVARTVCTVFAVLFGIGVLFGLAFTMWVYVEIGDNTEEYLLSKKLTKLAATIFFIGLMGAMFIPTKETVAQMMIASVATKENVSSVFDAIKSGADYVVQAIQQIKG